MPAACEAGIKAVEAELGPVDVLVNNAGITRDGMFHRMTFDQWSAGHPHQPRFDVHLTRPVIDGMRERGFGRIIIISSINGQKGQMGQTNYSAAKAGVIGFAKALAQENANKGITVNVIAPGYIATEMVQAVPEEVLKTKILPLIPVGRLGEAEEIARGVVYPRGRRCRLHHRLDAVDQRRPVHGLRAGIFRRIVRKSGTRFSARCAGRCNGGPKRWQGSLPWRKMVADHPSPRAVPRLAPRSDRLRHQGPQRDDPLGPRPDFG